MFVVSACAMPRSPRDLSPGDADTASRKRAFSEVNAWFREIYMYTGNTVHSASILLREGVAPPGEHDRAYIPVAL